MNKMDQKKSNEVKNKVGLRLNPLSMHVNPDLFVPATTEEKQELVVIRQGTSLWKDAMRRFRRNKFAMVLQRQAVPRCRARWHPVVEP